MYKNVQLVSKSKNVCKTKKIVKTAKFYILYGFTITYNKRYFWNTSAPTLEINHKKNNKLQKSGFFLSPICLNATKIKPDLDIIQ